MGITRVGPRLTLSEQMARKPQNRGRLLAVKYYTPRGGILRASETVGKSPQEIQTLGLQVYELRRVDLGIKMIQMPAGEFIFQGVKDVAFKGCKIAETPFTNGQFRKLLKLKPDELAQIVADPKKRLEDSLKVAAVPGKADDCPMVYISQIEAAGIAELLGYRLPTELEWERAAAYTDGREYPLQGKSPEGICGLVRGDVWEWTSSWYGEIDLSDPKNPKLAQSGNYRVLRGGWWCSYGPGGLRAASRNEGLPESRCINYGFRVAEDLE